MSSRSILKFAEQTFNLPAVGPASFGYTDTRATSMIDAFRLHAEAARLCEDLGEISAVALHSNARRRCALPTMTNSLQEGLSMTARLRAAAARRTAGRRRLRRCRNPAQRRDTGRRRDSAAAVRSRRQVHQARRHHRARESLVREYLCRMARSRRADDRAGRHPSGVKTIPAEADRRSSGGSLGHLFNDGINNWDNGKMDGFENNHLPRNNPPAGTYAYRI